MKTRLRHAWPWLAAALSGVLLGLCYPRWNISELIWVWQIPLLLAVWFSDGKKRWRRGLALGYVAGLTFFLINLGSLLELRHVAGTIWAGLGAWLALPGYLALYFGLWGSFAATVGRWEPGANTARTRHEDKGDLFGPSLGVLKSALLVAAAWSGLELKMYCW